MSGGNIRFDFKGKTAVVTGAGQGIGKAIAFAFALAGASVAAADIDLNGARSVVAEIAAAGGSGVAIRVDVSDSKSVSEMIAAAVSAFGGIDVLVNNAGITHRGDIFSLSEKGWDQLMVVNLKGVWLCSREVLKVMMKRSGRTAGYAGGPASITTGRSTTAGTPGDQAAGTPGGPSTGGQPPTWGRIVNIGSISGWLGGHEVGADYAVSKAGVAVLTKRMAGEAAAHGITVNSVAPHAIETPMTEGHGEEGKRRIVAKIPLGRFGRPEEVAAAVLFLASEEAGYITGQTLHVNGGTLMVY